MEQTGLLKAWITHLKMVMMVMMMILMMMVMMMMATEDINRVIQAPAIY